MKRITTVILLFCSAALFSQHRFSCVVKDSVTKEIIPGATIVVKGTANATATGADGRATLANIPPGPQTIEINFLGYRPASKNYIFPLNDTAAVQVLLSPDEHGELEEVIVSTTRTNSRIEDLATKVEVLGQDDMDEESTVVPGSITSILGDLSIITIQRTNPVNGNDAIRMQGLDARYTQIMRDGLPLYGGFSGSLGVLAIPPLDLRQVEIIKGSSSTLYGGGAIGGLINFISRAPVDTPQTTLTFNATTLEEYNINAYTSKRSGKFGATLFGGANVKTAYDVNGDGFAEVPEQKNVIIHPKLFYDFNSRNKLIVGLTTSYDTRRGGDMQAIRYRTDSIHTFLQQEKMLRNTVDLHFSSQLSDKNNLAVKSAVSAFNRAVNYSGFIFDGTQYSSYSEISDLIRLKNHTIILGANLMSESFVKNSSDPVPFASYNYYTIGGFVQDDWQIAKKLAMQLGFRYDNHNVYGSFYLPRISLFYKPSDHLSLRLSGGTGYKVPNLFDFASPSPALTPIQPAVRPEHSYGINADINYHTMMFGELLVQLNEALYYTHISDPITLVNYGGVYQTISNAGYYVNSYGTDTYVRFGFKGVELYLGYNHTEALRETDSTYVNMPFNPKDKGSATLAYTIEGKWRIGIEASYTGNQYININQKVNNFWFLAAMVEKKFSWGSVVLNCENLLDARQSRFERLVDGSTANPVFRPVWASLEGRVLNLCVKIAL